MRSQADSIDSELDEALARHRAGERDAACRVYRDILARTPDNRRALRYLGIAQVQSGAIDDGIALLERAVELAPTDARALSDLGRARAIAGDTRAAIDLFERAAAADPGDADPLHNLGVAADEAGDIPRAFDAYKAALRVDPTRAETFIALGDLLVRTDQADEAVECWRRAARYLPGDGSVRCRIGQSLSERGRMDEALTAFEDALAADPGCADAWVGIASVLEDQGDPVGAADAYRRALELDPGQGLAISRLLDLLGDEAEPWLVGRAEWALDAADVPDEAKALVGYGLGKARERRGDHSGAFAAWTAANRARRRVAGPLDRAALVARVDRLIEIFDARFFADRQGLGDTDARPVFVVGMPRSGTTLTERIIAAHPQAGGAGELPDLARLVSEAAYYAGPGVPWPESAHRLDKSAVADMARDYLSRLERAGGTGHTRLVDKAPLNFFALGLAALILPKARVVWCRRDPRDVCISIFGENFAPAQTHATELGDMVFYVRQYERLMAHWRHVLPLPVQEHIYERVVDDVETQSRELIEFLGLPWDDACLSFHEAAGAIQTPSRWQVRRPIYASSVGRWRHYRQWIEPLLDALGEADARADREADGRDSSG